MARRAQVHLVDDVSVEGAQETVRFSLDGTEYEIDLTGQNAQALRSALAGYVDRGRKAGSGGRPATSSPSTDKASREQTRQIRRWAQDNGYNPSARGRITRSIVDAYNESH